MAVVLGPTLLKVWGSLCDCGCVAGAMQKMRTQACESAGEEKICDSHMLLRVDVKVMEPDPFLEGRQARMKPGWRGNYSSITR
jgi:hypothetical protein